MRFFIRDQNDNINKQRTGSNITTRPLSVPAYWSKVGISLKKKYYEIIRIGCPVEAVAKAKRLEQLSAFQDKMKTVYRLTEGTIFGTYSVINGSLPRHRI